jgi:hypothetical protein
VGNVVLSNAENRVMDFYSTSEVNASDLTIKHVHRWHTDDMFSKFMFGAGKYDAVDFTPQAAMTTIRDYVAVVAMSILRVGPARLAKLAANDSYASKVENWMRLKP